MEQGSVLRGGKKHTTGAVCHRGGGTAKPQGTVRWVAAKVAQGSVLREEDHTTGAVCHGERNSRGTHTTGAVCHVKAEQPNGSHALGRICDSLHFCG